MQSVKPIALLVCSFLLVSSAAAQKPNPSAEIATLKEELKKAQEELAEAKRAQGEDAARIAALEEEVRALEERLAAMQSQPASAPISEEVQAALDAAREREAALEKRLSELELKMVEQESRYVKGGLTLFGYLSNIVRFTDLPNIVDDQGNVVDKRQDFDFFNNVVEIDLERGWGKIARVRADVDFLFNPGGGGQAFLVSVEQAFAEINVPVGQDLKLTFGRFNAPWGFEPVDAPGNFTVSRTNLFQLIRPKLFTGAMVETPFSEQVRGSLYITNGLEDNLDVKNNAKTFGARVDLRALPGSDKKSPWTLGLNFLAGSEQRVEDNLSGNNGPLGLFPDATLLAGLDYTFALGKLTIGGDALFGRIFDAQGGIEANQGANDFFGLNVTAHYEINPILGYTLRYDTFVDLRGALAGASGAVPLYPGRPADAPADLNVGGTLHSITGDINFTLIPNTPTQTFFELRLDRFDPETDGLATTSAFSASLQFIYSY